MPDGGRKININPNVFIYNLHAVIVCFMYMSLYSGLLCLQHSERTGLATQIVKSTDFSFVNVCTVEDIFGLSESAKHFEIQKINTK
jgi:hypothetical protein